MNLKRLLLTSLYIAAFAGMQAYASFTFKQQSRLASGSWVKVEIDSTGLYQIPYSTLQEMGFADPSQVGVYGKGGGLLSVNFNSSSEGVPYDDDISPVAVIHENDNLYFYALGVEDIKFSTGSQPQFKKDLRNIYSDTAYYFLSDCEEPVAAKESAFNSTSRDLPSGWDYIYHEIDLHQNTTNTGQLFWGEDFLDGQDSKEWRLNLPFNAGGESMIAYRLYTSPGSKGNVFINIGSSATAHQTSFSFNATDRFCVIPSITEDSPAKIEIPSQEEMTLSIRTESNDPDFLNLDYWLLSYQKELPGMNGLGINPAERYSFPLAANIYYNLTLKEGLRLLDVTSPKSMRIGVRDEENPASVCFRTTAANTSVLIYDPSRPQKHISGWSHVYNTDLHSLQTDGVELLIITVPRLRAYAEQVAELHSNYEGISVAVANVEEIYNEFSAGVPDPMAYRAMAKMLHQSEGNKLKNILLFGPSDRNLRRKVEGESKFDRIIAVQQASVTPDRDASPAYDFYGILSDQLSEVYLYRETMDVGVGLLSCETATDCERAIRKIEEYLTDDTQAWRVNETLTIGGLHDKHTHDQQAQDFGNYIRRYPGIEGMAHTTIAVDAYGNDGARRQMVSALEHGKIFSAYFGHGSSSMLGQDKKFFTTSEAIGLKNRHLGFMFMGGCDFSQPDIRSRGLGETIVLDSDRGMAGAIVSTRTAYSNQNYDLGKRIVNGWLAPKNKNVSPTIGEVYASAKSGATSSNSLTFILSGDPALKVPSPLRKVKVEALESVSAGQKIRVEGTVTDAKGETDNSFNGKIVLKLMEPSVTLRSKDYITNTGSTPDKTTVNGKDTTIYHTLDITYDTNILTALETEVKDGNFSTEILIPGAASAFSGKSLKLHAGVFDKSRWLGGAGSTIMKIGSAPSEGTDIDMSAPELTVVYDSSRQIISIKATDETALPLDAARYEATLDGKPVKLINEEYIESGESGKHFEGYADLYDLNDGKHSISVTCADIAGNKVSTTLDFEKLPMSAPLSLVLSTKTAVDNIEISVEGEHTGALDFEIINSAGEKVIYGSAAMTTSAVWDCRDMKGNRVPAGLYRVRVRSSQGADVTKYSDWATFAVLD